MRWQHPRRGLLGPDQFISLAEQSGLIRPLTGWVVRTALRQVGAWQRTGVTMPVAVNLSPHTLQEPAFADDIEALLRQHRVAIDDFGTGYSSLSYIMDLPVDELNIDRSFVRAMASDERHAAIVRSIVELGHSLGLRVVAEGLEDEETCLRLTALGCDLAQGYFLGHPAPAESVLGSRLAKAA